jgi:hypothetical protein
VAVRVPSRKAFAMAPEEIVMRAGNNVFKEVEVLGQGIDAL